MYSHNVSKDKYILFTHFKSECNKYFNNLYGVAMLQRMVSIVLLCCIVLISGCSNSDTTAPDTKSFKGFIYYSHAGEMYRLNLSTITSAKLFTNARHPDMFANGDILAVEQYPLVRLMRSDMTGANRNTILSGTDYTGPKYRQYMNRPRVSYNQQYIVYEGDNVYNPNSYVINSSDGSLVATIGDYNQSQPMISPSWSPDGSIVVAGWTSMNNGIYKVTPDFSSMKRVGPDFPNVSDPSVSPDGNFIAFIRDGQLWTMGIDGSNPTQLYVSGRYFRMPVWSPDSKYIAALNSVELTGKITIFEPQKKQITDLTTTGGNHYYIGDNEQLSWQY